MTKRAPAGGRTRGGHPSVMSAMDEVRNEAEELTGKGKEAAGEATGDRDLQAEGQADQASGDLEQAGETVEDVVT